MRYFLIQTGLRGGYMPDSSYPVAVKTRRELKQTLEIEAGYIRDSGATGLNKRAIASLANVAWRNPQSRLPFFAAWKPSGATNPAFGLFVCPVSRSEYVESQKEESF